MVHRWPTDPHLYPPVATAKTVTDESFLNTRGKDLQFLAFLKTLSWSKGNPFIWKPFPESKRWPFWLFFDPYSRNLVLETWAPKWAVLGLFFRTETNATKRHKRDESTRIWRNANRALRTLPWSFSNHLRNKKVQRKRLLWFFLLIISE